MSPRLKGGLVEAAGYTRERQIAIVKKLVERTVEELDAMKETPGFSSGKLVDVHTQPDYAARGRAADRLIHLFGASEEGNAGSGQGKVVIPLPPWVKMTVDTSKPPQPDVVQVVDTTATDVESSVSPATEQTPSDPA